MEPLARERRAKSIAGAIAVALVTIAFSSASASAAGGGGVAPGDPPVLNDVICLDRCAGERDATVGSLVRVVGRNLGYSSEVRFAGADGRIAAAASAAGAAALEAKVPAGAVTGTVRVGDAETPSRPQA